MSESTTHAPVPPSKPARKTWNEMTHSERRGGVIGLLVVAAIIAAMFALFGGDDTVVPVSTAAPPAPVGKEDVFAAALISQGIPVPDKAVAANAGRSVCTALDSGASPVQTALVVREAFNQGAGRTAISLEDAGYIVGASMGAFCPQHKLG